MTIILIILVVLTGSVVLSQITRMLKGKNKHKDSGMRDGYMKRRFRK